MERTKESSCSNRVCFPYSHLPFSSRMQLCLCNVALLVSNVSLQFSETLGAQDVVCESYCRLKKVFYLFSINLHRELL